MNGSQSEFERQLRLAFRTDPALRRYGDTLVQRFAGRQALIEYHRWLHRVERLHNARRMYPQLGYRYLYDG